MQTSRVLAGADPIYKSRFFCPSNAIFLEGNNLLELHTDGKLELRFNYTGTFAAIRKSFTKILLAPIQK